MKKEDTSETREEEADELRPEYDFSQLKGRVRGKYFERYREAASPATPKSQTDLPPS